MQTVSVLIAIMMLSQVASGEASRPFQENANDGMAAPATKQSSATHIEIKRGREMAKISSWTALTNDLLEKACQRIAGDSAEISDALGSYFLSLPLRACASHYELVWERVADIREQRYSDVLSSIQIDIAATNVPFDRFCERVMHLANSTSAAKKYQEELYRRRGWQLRKDQPVDVVRFYLTTYVEPGTPLWRSISLTSTRKSVLQTVRSAAKQWGGRDLIAEDHICFSNYGRMPPKPAPHNPIHWRQVVEIRKPDSKHGEAQKSSEATERHALWEKIEQATSAKKSGVRMRLVALLGLTDSVSLDLVVADPAQGRIRIVARFLKGRPAFDNLAAKFIDCEITATY